MKYLSVFLLFLMSCSGNSNKNYIDRGGAIADQLAKELSGIQTKEELVAQGPKIQKRYSQLVDLMIEARIEKQKRPHAFPANDPPTKSSQNLQMQLMRIYEIEGGRSFMEKLTRESLYRLESSHDVGFSQRSEKRPRRCSPFQE